MGSELEKSSSLVDLKEKIHPSVQPIVRDMSGDLWRRPAKRSEKKVP
jgi:hypothetical protein